MIVDSFIFNNEVDLLEIRLQTMDPFADRFVIVECGQTFQGGSKLFNFEMNKSRFKQFLHKIIYVTLPSFPVSITGSGHKFMDPWEYEYQAREAIQIALRRNHPDDWILISDVDEIPDMRKWDGKSEGLFECYQHYYYLNYRDPKYVMAAPVIVKMSTVHRIGSIQTLRRTRGDFLPRIPYPSGWHYSCMGPAEAISQKLKEFSHAEYNTAYWTSVDRIQQCMETGRDLLERDWLHKYEKVPVDLTFPPCVYGNPEKYAHLIKI